MNRRRFILAASLAPAVAPALASAPARASLLPLAYSTWMPIAELEQCINEYVAANERQRPYTEAFNRIVRDLEAATAQAQRLM